MGYIRHKLLVVIGWDANMATAHDLAQSIFGPENVTETLRSPANGYLSFMIGTSGSKLGWATSEEHNERIEEFKDKIPVHTEWHEITSGEEMDDLKIDRGGKSLG